MDTSDKVGLVLIFLVAIAIIAGIALGFYAANLEYDASVLRWETAKEIQQMIIDAKK